MYEIKKEERAGIIDELVRLLPDEKKADATTRVDHLADLYEGQDQNTIGVLWRAAEMGRFDEFAERLQEYHDEKGQHISVKERAYARNQDARVLNMLLQKEREIEAGTRHPKDRSYHPKALQDLARHVSSMEMELFFMDCYREMMK